MTLFYSVCSGCPASAYYAELQKHPEFNIHYEYKTMLFQGKIHIIDEQDCLTHAEFIKLNYQPTITESNNKPKRKCCQKGYNAVAEALKIKAEMDEKGITRAEYARMKGLLAVPT